MNKEEKEEAFMELPHIIKGYVDFTYPEDRQEFLANGNERMARFKVIKFNKYHSEISIVFNLGKKVNDDVSITFELSELRKIIDEADKYGMDYDNMVHL